MNSDKSNHDETTRLINQQEEKGPSTKKPRKSRSNRFGWTPILTLFLIGAAVGAVIYTVWFREDEKLTSGEYESGGKLAAARTESTKADSEELIEVVEESDTDSIATEQEIEELTDSVLTLSDDIEVTAPPLVEIESNDTPVDMGEAEKLPSFPGGDNAMYSWLKSNNKLTDDETAKGKVIVSFIVEKNGSISDVRIVRGRGARLDAEAVRLVKAMPAWTPGTNNGSPARIKYQLPITF